MTHKSDTENSKGNNKTPSRRQFLQYAGLAAGGGTLLAATPKLLSEGVVKGAVAQVVPEAPLPPHRAILVDGIHAYADQLSVKPGSDINFYVSSDTAYTFQIYRLGTKPSTDDPLLEPGSGSDEPMSGTMHSTPLQQPIHPGSYVYVENGLGTHANVNALTLECWVRPSVGLRSYPDPLNYTGLITQFDLQKGAGYGLFVRFDVNNLGANSRVAFYLGNGGAFNKDNLLEVDMDFLNGVAHWYQLQWHHIVATWDGKTQALWIDGGINGKPQLTKPFAGSVHPGPAPIRLAACGENGEASRFLNGDLAMPVIYDRALSQAEIENRYNQRFGEYGVQPPPLEHVWAVWPLLEEQSDDVADISPHKRLGSIVNHATWMIGGPSFSGKASQFGDYDPTDDPNRGHGLRFASDDLFDCRWQVTQTYTVPSNARSGIYVARLTTDAGQLYHVTFIVQKSDTQSPAPILLVCPTNTWLAYNSSPFMDQADFDPNNPDNPSLDIPRYSCYQTHRNFAPPFHFGLLVPRPAADPYATYGSNTYSHLTRATRFTQVWLDNPDPNGSSRHYAYDVISDLDLHNTPGILTKYQTVIIAGHSEYWSIPAYNGVKSYLSNRGRLIVLSGNTMYWRVSFSPDGTVMECRKVDGAGAQTLNFDSSRRGEAWHSDDGLRGGLMRECGFPGWQLTGLETLGILSFKNPSTPPPIPAGDFDFGTFYVDKDNANHFLFQGVPVIANQAFAQYTVGHESDVRIATLNMIRTAPVPDGQTDPVEPAGITTLAKGHGATICCFPFDYFLDTVNVDPVGELIYWQRLDGGRVFNGGAIGNGAALYYKDPVFTGLMKNVLTYFLGP